MARELPSPSEARAILARRRARPMPGPPPGAVKALSPTLKSLEARFGQGADGLKGRWREIVGDVLARRSEPVRLIRARSGGPAALELRVDGPSATLIQHQAEDLLARVNLFLGERAVDRLRIVQGPVKAAPARPRPGPGASRPRTSFDAPLDAAAEAALESDLAALAQGPLRTALARLGRAVLRRERTKS